MKVWMGVQVRVEWERVRVEWVRLRVGKVEGVGGGW